MNNYTKGFSTLNAYDRPLSFYPQLKNEQIKTQRNQLTFPLVAQQGPGKVSTRPGEVLAQIVLNEIDELCNLQEPLAHCPMEASMSPCILAKDGQPQLCTRNSTVQLNK